MGIRWDVKHCARIEVEDPSVVEGGGRMTAQHEAEVFDGTATCADDRPVVQRPFPSRLVCRASQCLAGDVNNFKVPLLELSTFVGRLEVSKNRVEVSHSSTVRFPITRFKTR